MAKRKHILTMRQSMAWRLSVGLLCLFAAAWMFEQQGNPLEPGHHPLTAALLVIVGLALIRGWWTIKRRLDRVIAEAIAESKEAAKHSHPPHQSQR